MFFYFFFIKKTLDNVLELVSEGSVISEASPSSFLISASREVEKNKTLNL